ncbi:YybH family protein [Pseudobdellovibrio sp. HCB154]|uniref:YybH family protein n=1 Tax=Pseudobdellovibrio sp. HCB154 TaxID=3386277 RepID=UPI00391748A8
MEQNKDGSTTVDTAAERARAAVTNIGKTTPVNVTGATKEASEGEIRQLLEEFADAIRSGKIEDIMSFYDPGLIAFDVVPPLRFTNANEYRKNWETQFTSKMQFPVSYEFSEEKLQVDGDLGVFHALIHTAGTIKEPQQGEPKEMDCWGRYTCVLKKMNNRWRIFHEHFSVPVAEDGKALMNLKPGYQVSH